MPPPPLEPRPEASSEQRHIRAHGGYLIQSAVRNLTKKSLVVSYTACSLFQRFFFKASFTEYDYRTVAVAALCLACKQEEVRVDMDSVIAAFSFDLEKDDVKRCERHLLRHLGFEPHRFSCAAGTHPGSFLCMLADLLLLPQALTQVTNAYINDSARTSLSCEVTPLAICVGALQVASRVEKIALPFTCSSVSNPQCWPLDVDVEYVVKNIFALYELPRSVPVVQHAPLESAFSDVASESEDRIKEAPTEGEAPPDEQVVVANPDMEKAVEAIKDARIAEVNASSVEANAEIANVNAGIADANAGRIVHNGFTDENGESIRPRETDSRKLRKDLRLHKNSKNSASKDATLTERADRSDSSESRVRQRSPKKRRKSRRRSLARSRSKRREKVEGRSSRQERNGNYTRKKRARENDESHRRDEEKVKVKKRAKKNELLTSESESPSRNSSKDDRNRRKSRRKKKDKEIEETETETEEEETEKKEKKMKPRKKKDKESEEIETETEEEETEIKEKKKKKKKMKQVKETPKKPRAKKEVN